jgi:hypothetical protein
MEVCSREGFVLSDREAAGWLSVGVLVALRTDFGNFLCMFLWVLLAVTVNIANLMFLVPSIYVQFNKMTN